MSTPGESFDGNDFLLPDLGEGLDDAELVEWCVEPGQAFEELEVVAKMETAKSLVEVNAPKAGVVGKLHGQPGDIIKVGKPLITYASDKADAPKQPVAAAAAESKAESKLQTAAKADDVPTGGGSEGDVFSDEAQTEGEESGKREDAGTVVGSLQPLAGASAEDGQPLAAPAVRRLARDLDVDLHQIEGTGIGGRITAADVRAAAPVSKAPARSKPDNGTNGRHAAEPERERTAPPAKSQVATPDSKDDGGGVTRIPFRGVRRTIANRLRESVDKAVHFTVMDEADVTRLEATRKKFIAATGHKISLLPFACLAVARVLSGEFGYEMARLNSTLDEDSGDILQHKKVHLGLAVDTSSGLMVPKINNANSLGVMELAGRIADLAAACRDRSVPQKDLQGSTFTVSNFGSYAGRFATPVINYPEAGILAVGRMREGVVVKNGMMGVGKLLPLSLTCDHRVIDGGTATMTLNAIIGLLQDPDVLLPE